jgi:hypothetical protein
MSDYSILIIQIKENTKRIYDLALTKKWGEAENLTYITSALINELASALKREKNGTEIS